MKKSEVKESKLKKTKKDQKKYSAKKLPRMFKKAYSEKKLEIKILNKLYIPTDKNQVRSLFEKGANLKKSDFMAIPKDKVFTKSEVKHYKLLAKQISKQKTIFSFVSFVAVVSVIVSFGIIFSIFKNPVTKKVLVLGCQKVACAKTEISSVNLKIFDATLTVNGLAVGNKDEEFKNIFEAEKIELAFNLAQALRGRFDCKNIEVAGMQFNTDRKTSCKLPKKILKAKNKKSNDDFVNLLNEKKDEKISNLKSQLQSLLGGASPEEIAKNLESKLQTPTAAKEAKETTEAMITKWKDKPAEVKNQIEDFSSSVKKLQKINPSDIKDLAELKSTIETLNTTIEQSKKIKESVSSITNDVKTDSKKVSELGETVQKKVAEDKKLVENTVGTAVNTVKNAKAIMNDAIEAILMDSLGKYYPYAKKGLAYVESMNSSSTVKKEKPKVKKAKKIERKRLKGTTFWYGTTKPSFLVENIFASGPGFEARIVDVSNDMDLLGKPMKGEGSFSVGKTSHNANIIIDTRSSANAKLITANYSGKGFGAKIDGSSIASATGIPSVEGIAAIKMNGVFYFDGFSASGDIDLNPVKLTSDGIGNETSSKYYNKALASVSRIRANYKTFYSVEDGISLSLGGNFGDQFANALSSVASEIGNDAKNLALSKLNEKINSSSNEALASVKKFVSIEKEINVQNSNLNSVQDILESKKAQLEKELKKRATSAIEDKLPTGTKDSLKSIKSKLPF